MSKFKAPQWLKKAVCWLIWHSWLYSTDNKSRHCPRCGRVERRNRANWYEWLEVKR